MKLINNNLSPLPFYDSLEKQNHRKSYAFGQVYPLITYKNMLLPFQVVLTKGTKVNWAKLYSLKGDIKIDITDSLIENGITIVNKYSGFVVLKYPGTLPITEIKQEGQYYLAISVNEFGIIYSDVFTVCNDVSNCLLIEYRNNKGLALKNGIIDFSDNFKFKCYVCAGIGKPEYIFEEEATERMGYTFIESQISKKVYKFTFLAPEYLCDALRIVRLCEDKQIVSNGQTYDLTTFSMEPKWEEQGDLAAVECEFETDTVIANTGGFEPVPLGGDFTSAYNNDYLKE